MVARECQKFKTYSNLPPPRNCDYKFLKKLLCLFQSSQKNSATRPSFFVRYIFLLTGISNIYTLCYTKTNIWCVHENGGSISKTFSEQIRWLNGKVLDWYTLFFLFQISFFRNNLMSNIVVRCKIKKFPGTFSLTSVKENGRLLYCDIAIWVEKETLFLTPFFTSVWKLTQSWRL